MMKAVGFIIERAESGLHSKWKGAPSIFFLLHCSTLMHFHEFSI